MTRIAPIIKKALHENVSIQDRPFALMVYYSNGASKENYYETISDAVADAECYIDEEYDVVLVEIINRRTNKVIKTYD